MRRPPPVIFFFKQYRVTRVQNSLQLPFLNPMRPDVFGVGETDSEGTTAMWPGTRWCRKMVKGLDACGGGASISNFITTATLGSGLLLINHGRLVMLQGGLDIVGIWDVMVCRMVMHGMCIL